VPARRPLTWIALACITLVAGGQLVIVVHKLAAGLPALTVFDEDAFYIFSVARNLATGHGPSADGHHLTNGFQPAWTLLSTLVYLCAGGNERAWFGMLYTISFGLWLLSAFLFGRLVARMSANRDEATGIYAAAWFLADPTLQWNAFNGLETGAYVCALLWLATLRDVREWKVGLALGLLFWIRNDAVLLAAPWLVAEWIGGRRRRALTIGLVAAATFCPWPAFNLWLGGSPVPQSGTAISVGVNAMTFGWAKLRLAIDMVVEYLVQPIAPASRVPWPFKWLLGALVLGTILFVCRNRVRRAVPILAGVLLLCGYYVAGSGAYWYFLRYFVPLKLVLLVAVVLSVSRLRPALLVAALGLTVFNCVHRWGFNYHAEPHLGSDVAALLEHRPGRVGMFESGRAGFVLPHDVVNLDGKVNGEALHAILSDHFEEYLGTLGLDGLYCRDYDLGWLDAHDPHWRNQFGPGQAWAGPGRCSFYPKRSSPPP
jgi:hypothetical protein